MNFTRKFLLALALVPVLAWGSGLRYLERSKTFCDDTRKLCIRGSIIYRSNSRVMTLTGRVSKTSGPGWVRILFRGSNRLNQPSTSLMEFAIRGAHSEIIDKSFIPDQPDVDNWRILSFAFEPDEKAGRIARDRN